MKSHSPHLGVYTLLDQKTGEAKNLIELSPEHSVVHKNSSKAFKEKQRVDELKQQSRGKTWVACYHEPIKEKTKGLNLTECGVIMKLIPYLQFQGEGMLIKDNKPMKLKDIQEAIGKSKPATIKLLDSLEQQEIVFKLKKGRANLYFVNSQVHTIGEVLKGMLFTKLYQNKTKEILERISLHEAGILYKILPYFHYKNYHLCSNPDEEDKTKINYISREELAKLINHDEKTLYRNMQALCDNGAIMIKKARKKVRYMVHPDLMFRQEYQNNFTQAARDDFDIFEN